jgi:hypothetical protein
MSKLKISTSLSYKPMNYVKRFLSALPLLVGIWLAFDLSMDGKYIFAGTALLTGLLITAGSYLNVSRIDDPLYQFGGGVIFLLTLLGLVRSTDFGKTDLQGAYVAIAQRTVTMECKPPVTGLDKLKEKTRTMCLFQGNSDASDLLVGFGKALYYSNTVGLIDTAVGVVGTQPVNNCLQAYQALDAACPGQFYTLEPAEKAALEEALK